MEKAHFFQWKNRKEPFKPIISTCIPPALVVRAQAQRSSYYLPVLPHTDSKPLYIFLFQGRRPILFYGKVDDGMMMTSMQSNICLYVPIILMLYLYK